MRQAEAWASGEPWEAPAPPAAAPGVFVGGELSPELAPELSPELSPELGPELGPELAPDLVGEPWKDYRDLDDDDWATLKPFLPETMEEDRALISGVLWVFTTRAGWKDMPAHFANFHTARGRVTKLRSLELW